MGLGSGYDSQRKTRKKKKHHCKRKSELKVTNRGEGKDSSIWTQASSGSDTTTEPDRGFGSNQKHHLASIIRSVTQQDCSQSSDWTPLLSPNTQQKLDVGNSDDDPLSDHADFAPSKGNQEMVSAKEHLGTDLGGNANEDPMGRGPVDIEMGGGDTGANP